MACHSKLQILDFSSVPTKVVYEVLGSFPGIDEVLTIIIVRVVALGSLQYSTMRQLISHHWWTGGQAIFVF